MIDIVQRVEASLRMDAINGDGMERSVFESQIRELVQYTNTLQDRVEDLEIEIENDRMGGSV